MKTNCPASNKNPPLKQNILNQENKRPLTNTHKQIKAINEYISSESLHEDIINCILQLTDKRIVTGSDDRSLTISSINLETKEWIILYKKDQAHNGWINYLCEVNIKKLLSCSQDKTMKLWDISEHNELIIETIVIAHSGRIIQMIPLFNENIIACSNEDNTVKLWSNTFENQNVPFQLQKQPKAILNLKSQNTIICISCFNSGNGYLIFYSIVPPYEQQGKTIKGVYTGWSHGMIELQNGHLAVSKYNPICVQIVDPIKYIKIANINNNDYLYPEFSSALGRINDNSFICIRKGFICKIDLIQGDYKVVYGKKEKVDVLYGYGGILFIDEENYFMTDRGDEFGINVFKIQY